MSIKHLLQAIQTHRSDVPLPDGQLWALLTDAHRSRDQRDEFLQSIDRVLAELRAYTEHSAAFLSRVSKRVAPDYDAVIKRPMDLGTMQKKVRQGQYRTKKQFALDLDLIWNNCLLYNSDPAHPLRRNAYFMRKKAAHLLNFVHDKSESKDALLHWDALASTWQDQTPPTGDAVQAPPGLDGAHTIAGSEGSAGTSPPLRAPVPHPSIPFAERPALLRSPQGMCTFASWDQAVSALEDPSCSSSRQQGSHLSPTDSRPRITSSHPAASACPASFHSPHLLDRETLSNAIHDQRMAGPLHLALTCSSGKTASASSSSISTSNPLDDLGGPSSSDVSSNPASTVGTEWSMDVPSALGSWWDAMPSTSMMANGLPLAPAPSRRLTHQEEHARQSHLANRLRRAKRKRLYAPEGPHKRFRNRIPQSIETLAKVRSVHAKLGALIQANEADEPVPSWALEAEEDPGHADTDEEEAEMELGGPQRPHTGPSHNPRRAFFLAVGQTSASLDPPRGEGCVPMAPHSRVTPAGAVGAMAHVAAQLASVHGTNASHRAPLLVLADLGGQVISALGRALRSYADRQPTNGPSTAPQTEHGSDPLPTHSPMDPGEMVAHALNEVCGQTAESLHTYIRHVERQRSRYNDLLRRLTQAWEGQVNVSTTRLADAHERLFADPGSTALATGAFADETGIDFFGFRDLGIDVGALSVPAHLLQGAERNLSGPMKAEGAEPSLSGAGMAFPPPPPYVPLTPQGIEEQIGLLCPLLAAHPHASKDKPLPDDDVLIFSDSKSKTGLSGRAPPTGKLPPLPLAQAGRLHKPLRI